MIKLMTGLQSLLMMKQVPQELNWGELSVESFQKNAEAGVQASDVVGGYVAMV